MDPGSAVHRCALHRARDDIGFYNRRSIQTADQNTFSETVLKAPSISIGDQPADPR